MDVPIEARARAEGRVGAREEFGGEVGGDVAADEVVKGCCEEEFVDVEVEGGEREGGGEGFRQGCE